MTENVEEIEVVEEELEFKSIDMIFGLFKLIEKDEVLYWNKITELRKKFFESDNPVKMDAILAYKFLKQLYYQYKTAFPIQGSIWLHERNVERIPDGIEVFDKSSNLQLESIRENILCIMDNVDRELIQCELTELIQVSHPIILGDIIYPSWTNSLRNPHKIEELIDGEGKCIGHYVKINDKCILLKVKREYSDSVSTDKLVSFCIGNKYYP